jgi:indole-3-glycerol phosphate synthase
MSNGKRIYLEDIVAKKKQRIDEKNYSIEVLKKQISQIKERPSFYEALKKEGLSIIGEIKKASPSKGLIKPDFNPLEIAKVYEENVEAISVLTEEDYFLGKDAYLKAVSEQVNLPTLCKDFILDPRQIYNAKALGASCILLIVAILTDDELVDFLAVAESLSIDVLVEVHTLEELKRALKTKAKIIGINNRDLKSFETNVVNTLTLRKHIPDGIVVVSESGIHGINEILQLKEANIDAILVGESFMRTGDIKQHAKELKDAYKA